MVSYRFISYIVSYHIISYTIYRIISYLIIYNIIWYRIDSYHISYHIISYFIIYHIISYHISYHILLFYILFTSLFSFSHLFVPTNFRCAGVIVAPDHNQWHTHAHTPHTHTTLRRTPLDGWLARRRDLYLTTHDTQNRHLSPGGIRSNSPSKRAATDPCLRPHGHVFNCIRIN